jgi:hypothetical protein
MGVGGRRGWLNKKNGGSSVDDISQGICAGNVLAIQCLVFQAPATIKKGPGNTIKVYALATYSQISVWSSKRRSTREMKVAFLSLCQFAGNVKAKGCLVL